MSPASAQSARPTRQSGSAMPSCRSAFELYTRRMPKFVLSAHAETVTVERSIKTEWLERVLSHPEKVEADRENADLKHALGHIPEHGNRVLRVVYNGTVRPIRVVTVYFDRTLRNKL